MLLASNIDNIANLVKFITSLIYLVCQGLAIMKMMMTMRVSEIGELDHFLRRTDHNLHLEIEDEILQLSSK